MSTALRRYQVMAYVVGVMLLVLVLVAMPLKYLADTPSVVAVVGPVHGVLFAGYVLVALLLGLERRWSPLRIVTVLLAGVVPFLSFVVERRVTRETALRP